MVAELFLMHALVIKYEVCVARVMHLNLSVCLNPIFYLIILIFEIFPFDCADCVLCASSHTLQSSLHASIAIICAVVQ